MALGTGVPRGIATARVREALGLSKTEQAREFADPTSTSLKAVQFTFRPGSSAQVQRAATQPVLFVPVSDDAASRVEATAAALLRLLQSRLAQELSRAERNDDQASDTASEAASQTSVSSATTPPSRSPRSSSPRSRSPRPKSSRSGSPRASSAASTSVEMDVGEATERLRDIMARARRRDEVGAQLERELGNVITALWPRRKRADLCIAHKNYEIGRSNRPCKDGVVCRFSHALQSCRHPGCSMVSKDGKKGRQCAKVHDRDIDDLLRLDVKLAQHLQPTSKDGNRSKRPSFPELCDALVKHRTAMMEESNMRLAKHGEKIRLAEERLMSTQEEDTASEEGPKTKGATVEAIRKLRFHLL